MQAKKENIYKTYVEEDKFDLKSYDIENIKIATSSASIAIKPNFNSYVGESSTYINNKLYPSTTILPQWASPDLNNRNCLMG